MHQDYICLWYWRAVAAVVHCLASGGTTMPLARYSLVERSLVCFGKQIDTIRSYVMFAVILSWIFHYLKGKPH